jgi:uncharacterized membrane protein
MVVMKPKHFIARLDRQQIEQAIQRAERLTSGEIRVVIHRQPADDAVVVARAEFVRLGMPKTRHRNAVLLFVAPTSQSFAIIGDEGVHAKCGDAFWSEVAAAMQKNFRDGHHTAAIIEGINRAGVLLAEHFPPEPGAANELPNQVIER